MQLEKTPGTSWCPLISLHLCFVSFVSFSFSLSFSCSLFLPWKERRTQPSHKPCTAHTFLSPLVQTSRELVGTRYSEMAMLFSQMPSQGLGQSLSSKSICDEGQDTLACLSAGCSCHRVIQAVTQPRHSSCCAQQCQGSKSASRMCPGARRVGIQGSLTLLLL